MAWTPTTFKERWPEFVVDDALVQKALDDAAEYNDERLLGAQYDAGVGLYAAHLLAMQQPGQPARLDPKAIKAANGALTTYQAQWRDLAYAKAGGMWTIGVGPTGVLP